MTTQVRTHEQQGGHGHRTPLAMTALTLVVLGAFALWQLWPGGEGAAQPTAGGATPRSVTTAAATDGVIPVAGPVEQAGTNAAAPPFGVVALTDGNGHYRTEAAGPLGRHTPAASAGGACGTELEPASC